MEVKEMKTVEMTAEEMAQYEEYKEWKQRNTQQREIKTQEFIDELTTTISDEIYSRLKVEDYLGFEGKSICEGVAIWAVAECALELDCDFEKAKANIDAILNTVKNGAFDMISSFQAEALLRSNEEIEIEHAYEEELDKIKTSIKKIFSELEQSEAEDAYCNITEWLICELGQ